MTAAATTLDEAREALARCEWAAAYDVVVAAGLASSDDPERLELFAETAWWVSRLDECIETRERAYSTYEQRGDRRGAARVAMLLFDDHRFKSRRAAAGGWLRRAERLLADEPGCLEHGSLHIRQAETAHTEDVAGAIAHAEQAVDIGRRLADADLEADALQALGRVLITEGKPAEGLGLFDEAMLLAAEGKLGPFVTGKVYCSLISACEELSDFQRAAEWTDVGARWADNHPITVFPGLCRVHRAEVLQRKGAWAEAEKEARRACTELDNVNLFNTGAGFYEIGEIRRRLGDLVGAEEAFRRADELGRQPQPGLALLRLAQGRVDAAAASISRVLSEGAGDRLGRAKLLPALVEIAIAAGHLDDARGAVDELTAIAEQYASPGLQATASLAGGRLELTRGDAGPACATLRRALHEWQALDLPYEVASTRVLLGLACRAAGDEEAAAASFDAAVAIFQRLGADLDAKNAKELRSEEEAAPDGLTGRELEVLRLVASGQSNKQVATELYLSQKTVARHLSNIFVKIGVSSRSAATAYAFEHGIVGAAS